MASRTEEVARLRRWAAMLGVVGGTLRAAGSFAPAFIKGDTAQAWLYFSIDICLIGGLLSVYLSRRRRMNAVGQSGALLALTGLIANRTIPVVSHVDIYSIAATAIAIGLLALTVAEWRARRMALWIPATFGLSILLGGLSMFVAGAGMLFLVSGVLFGAAFAGMAWTANISVAPPDPIANSR